MDMRAEPEAPFGAARRIAGAVEFLPHLEPTPQTYTPEATPINLRRPRLSAGA